MKFSGQSKDTLNHNRDICDDGAWSGKLHESSSGILPYPQHKDIFNGRKINRLGLIRRLASALTLSYRITVLKQLEDISAEDCNLSTFLNTRIKDVDGLPMMSLEGLEVDEKDVVVQKDGLDYLKLDLLKVQ